MQKIIEDKLKRKIFDKLMQIKEKYAENIVEFANIPVDVNSERLSNLGIYDPKRTDEMFITKSILMHGRTEIPKDTTIRVVRSNVSFDLVDIFWHPKAGDVPGNKESITASINVSMKKFMEWKIDALEPIVPDMPDEVQQETISFKKFNRLEEDVVKDLRKIAKSDQFADVTFKDKSTFEVDTFTARIIIKVLDTLNPQNKKKMTNFINKDKDGFLFMVDFAFKNTQ